MKTFDSKEPKNNQSKKRVATSTFVHYSDCDNDRSFDQVFGSLFLELVSKKTGEKKLIKVSQIVKFFVFSRL